MASGRFNLGSLDFGKTEAETPADATDFVRSAAVSAGGDEFRYVDPSEIHARAQEDLFSLDARHVVAIAETFRVTEGLIKPIYLDRTGKLVDGLHRMTAVRLVRTSPHTRATLFQELMARGARHVDEDLHERAKKLPHLPELMAIVRYGDFDAASERGQARTIEILANAVHKPRRSEFKRIVDKVRGDESFWMGRGRPKRGTRSGKQFLAQTFGVDERTVHNWLVELDGKGKQASVEERQIKQLRSCVRALQGLRREVEKGGEGRGHHALLAPLVARLDDFKAALKELTK